MSLKRTAILLAVSHSNHHANHHNHSTSPNIWSSLSSGSTNSHSNATDFYTATNFNHTNKSYNNQGMRALRPGVGGFNGNVNILLGGAMLTVVTTIVCLICYCCHRKVKMQSSSSSLYRQQRWLENDPNMEIYSVEQYFDTSGLYSESDNLQTMQTLNEPPPSYDCVMALNEVITRKRKNLYTFKGYHPHPGHAIKDCPGNTDENSTPTPQVSLDETHCDIRSPSSAMSFCNCNCSMNQNFSANLCTNCSNEIDNADNENNNVASPLTRNPERDDCPLTDTNRLLLLTEFDLLNRELNNNDLNGNTTTSASTSTSIQYVSCPVPLGSEIQRSLNEDANEIDGNGNCRSLDAGMVKLDLSQIIDQTGLPTYEAALQLKSNGYV